MVAECFICVRRPIGIDSLQTQWFSAPSRENLGADDGTTAKCSIETLIPQDYPICTLHEERFIGNQFNDSCAPRFYAIFTQQRKSTGGVPGPMDCWLTLRGIKTLHLRMRQHNQNGLTVARYLEDHPAVDRVLYPGLESHPQHELAARQMIGFTGMVSVDVGTLERARALTEHLRVFALAESLGGVESLISVPALMTHASVPADRREAMGVTPGLVRLSVGVEDEADLLDDLQGVLG